MEKRLREEYVCILKKQIGKERGSKQRGTERAEKKQRGQDSEETCICSNFTILDCRRVSTDAGKLF